MGNNGSQTRGRRHRRKHARDSEQPNDQNMSVSSATPVLRVGEQTPPPAPASTVESSKSSGSISSLKSEKELVR